MHRVRSLSAAAVAAAALVAACAESPSTPAVLELEVFEARGESHHFVAPLSGAEEVPPVDTRARGTAVFSLTPDGSAIGYRLTVAHIEGVTQAHIHLAPAGSNGPFVVFLFGPVAAGTSVNGILAEGTFTEADLVARPAIGFGGTMEELLSAMRGGGAYVNVHTRANPPGEIRGQVREAGPSI
jgi:hypothetical protein